MKKLIVVISLCFLFFYGCETNNSSQLESAERKPQIINDIPIDMYWFSFFMGFLKELEEDEKFIYGKVFVYHGYADFKVNKNDINNLEFKTNGAIRTIKHNISIIKYSSEYSRPKESAFQKLYEITGSDFDSYEKWNQWFINNEKNLIWSNKLNQLVIRKYK